MTAPTPTPLPARGAKRETSLTVPGGAADGGTLTVPLLLAQGVHAGPRVAVLGGIHGDEYEGIAAAGAVWRDLSPENLRGSVAVVPVCNPLAYAAGARSTPQDGQNLARVFPGRPDGSPTKGIAHALSEAVIRQCDFLIDLHGAGQHYAMPLLCGIYVGPDALGQRCAAAALAFGAPVFWGHPEVAPGRSLSVALDAGIPCLYAECGGGGRVRPQHLQDYRAGVQRVLAHLGMIADAPPSPVPALRLRSGGNTDHAQAVSHAGLLLHRVRLLDPVNPGQPLGDVLDERGTTLETLYAPAIGRVIMARRTARVVPGDGAYLLATEAPPDEYDHPK